MQIRCKNKYKEKFHFVQHKNISKKDNMIVSIIFIAFSSSFVTSTRTNLTTPSWQNLDCEPYHKYLFSEIATNWEDARAECELYGGWLLSINSMQEQNCLLRYARSGGLSVWYRHDGGGR